MKNILDSNVRDEIRNRISKIQDSSAAQWGHMNANEMLCHLTDQIRIATGEMKVKSVGNFFSRKILKNLVLGGLPAPKGKAKTVPEMDQKIAGTKPTNFDNDKKILLDEIENFSSAQNASLHPHPYFGEMSRQQWGRLMYTHANHHLKQFGV